jgi:aspartate/methionine/tyrosine aminotransferase
VTTVLPVSGRGQVAPFQVMRVLDAASRRRAAGLPTFDLSAGQPGTPAPVQVLEAARQALSDERLGYTPASGIPLLRQAIAGHYKARYDLAVDADDVVVTTGSSGGFLLAFLAAFDAGDVVVLARPGYPAYRNLLEVLGCRVVEIEAGPAENFTITTAMLDRLPRPPKGLVLASPANPTGTLTDPQTLADVVAWCARNGTRLVSDEIYHGLVYRGSEDTVWRTSRDPIVVNSFSKYFSMTGWRLGWLLVPPELRDPIDALASNLALCPPALSQHAAIRAFEAYDELDSHARHYRANRDLLVAGLTSLGLDRLAPADGAFYVYADVSAITDDSAVLCSRALPEAGVAIAPGADFDTVDGHRWVRMSFAGATAEVIGAIEALDAWLPGL